MSADSVRVGGALRSVDVILSPHEQAALIEFAERVRASFGDRVDQITLFGSRARGVGVHEDSDIDVCVAIRGLEWQEKSAVFELAGATLEKHDVVLSLYLVSAEHLEDLRRRERAIAADIARDGIPL